MVKLLFICTSSDRKGKFDEPTGVWAEELAAPYNYFTEQGFEVVISSVKGGQIPLDPASLTDDFRTPDVDLFLQNSTSIFHFISPLPTDVVTESVVEHIKNSLPVATMSSTDFDAVFVPGGLGVMYDMPENAVVGQLLTEVWSQRKIVSAVCHGPGALLSAKEKNGEALIKGKRVTGLTNTEEEATGNVHKIDYLLEDKMKEQGGIYVKGDDWSSFVEQDGLLVTGQNPQSSKKLAEVVVSLLKESQI